MAPSCFVRKAISTDLPYLAAIERSASALFRSVALVAHFADGEPSLSAGKQAELCENGTLWVVLAAEEGPAGRQNPQLCGFAAAERVDNSIYIWELSVHADYQRQGLSGVLLAAVTNYARDTGLQNVTLMTERDVPWNGPAYRKKGFSDIDPPLLGPGHEQIAQCEREEGFDMSRRVMMFLSPHRLQQV